MKVLIADDSAFMRAILKRALGALPGAEFIEAENGDVALELFAAQNPELVFLDIVMPIKDGLQTLREMKAIRPDVRAIMVTSLGQDEVKQQAEEMGASAYITKPFDPPAVYQVVRQLYGL